MKVRFGIWCLDRRHPDLQQEMWINAAFMTGVNSEDQTLKILTPGKSELPRSAWKKKLR